MKEISEQEAQIPAEIDAQIRLHKGSLPASRAHQIVTLVGASFIFFEIIFVQLYSDKFWFSLDLGWLGIPSIVLVCVFAHFFLSALESDRACRWFGFLWRGKPPVVYRRWIELDESGFTYGIRHIQWSAVDELRLTFFGNLEVRSFALSGKHEGEPDLLFKFPFAPAVQGEQNKFLQAALGARPHLKFNKRMSSRIKSPLIKGQNMVQYVGAAFTALLLLDLGRSSFNFLEMLKHYYLADNHAMIESREAARFELARADEIREGGLHYSWIFPRMVSYSKLGAGVAQARARVFWSMHEPQPALAAIEDAIEMSPQDYRLYLTKARYLSDSGRQLEANSAIEASIKNYKTSLLPRLYLVANGVPDDAAMLAKYRQAESDLQESVLGQEPAWPPGGARFLIEKFYQHDLDFIFGRLLGTQQQQKEGKNARDR